MSAFFPSILTAKISPFSNHWNSKNPRPMGIHFIAIIPIVQTEPPSMSISVIPQPNSILLHWSKYNGISTHELKLQVTRIQKRSLSQNALLESEGCEWFQRAVVGGSGQKQRQLAGQPNSRLQQYGFRSGSGSKPELLSVSDRNVCSVEAAVGSCSKIWGALFFFFFHLIFICLA